MEDLPIPSGLVDTIPDFFTLVRGRPVKEKFNKREFIAGCRYRFIQNLEQGFMCDIIKQVEDQTKIQTTVLEDAVQESRDMKKLMDLFLADQQKEAVALEENFKKIKNDRETIEAEHKYNFLVCLYKVIRFYIPTFCKHSLGDIIKKKKNQICIHLHELNFGEIKEKTSGYNIITILIDVSSLFSNIQG